MTFSVTLKKLYMSNIRNKVVGIITDGLGVKKEACTDAANLSNDLGADELDFPEIVLNLEKEFDIEISLDDMENIRTVGDCVRVVEEKQ